MGKVSGTSLYLAGIFLVIFNNYMCRQFPNSEDKPGNSEGEVSSSLDSFTYKWKKYIYIVLASSGIMLLFSTAIVAHTLHRRLYRYQRHNAIKYGAWRKIVHSTSFIGVACNLVSLALGIMMIHSDPNEAIACYVIPFCVIFIATLIIVCFLERRPTTE